jgi:hypothetical protein
MGLGLLAALLVWPVGPAAAQTSLAPAKVTSVHVTMTNGVTTGGNLIDTYQVTVYNDSTEQSVYFYVWAQVGKNSYSPQVITHEGAEEPVGKGGWSLKLAPGKYYTVNFTVHSGSAERYCSRSSLETPVCSEIVNPLPSATVLDARLYRSTYYDPSLDYQEEHWDWVQITVRNDTPNTGVSFELRGEGPAGPFTPIFTELYGGVKPDPYYTTRWVVQDLAPGKSRTVSLKSVENLDATRYCALGLLSACSSGVVEIYG